MFPLKALGATSFYHPARTLPQHASLNRAPMTFFSWHFQPTFRCHCYPGLAAPRHCRVLRRALRVTRRRRAREPVPGVSGAHSYRLCHAGMKRACCI